MSSWNKSTWKLKIDNLITCTNATSLVHEAWDSLSQDTLLHFVKTLEDITSSVCHQLFKISALYSRVPHSSHLMKLHQALTSSKQSSTWLEIYDLCACNLLKILGLSSSNRRIWRQWDCAHMDEIEMALEEEKLVWMDQTEMEHQHCEDVFEGDPLIKMTRKLKSLFRLIIKIFWS